MILNEDTNEDLGSVMKTVLLFLESHNFKTTYRAMLDEAVTMGISNVDDYEPKILVLKPCPCEIHNITYNKSTATEVKRNDKTESQGRKYILESTTLVQVIDYNKATNTTDSGYLLEKSIVDEGAAEDIKQDIKEIDEIPDTSQPQPVETDVEENNEISDESQPEDIEKDVEDNNEVSDNIQTALGTYKNNVEDDVDEFTSQDVKESSTEESDIDQQYKNENLDTIRESLSNVSVNGSTTESENNIPSEVEEVVLKECEGEMQSELQNVDEEQISEEQEEVIEDETLTMSSTVETPYSEEECELLTKEYASQSDQNTFDDAFTQAALKASRVSITKYFDLDYDKVKATLKNSTSYEEVCKLLQALRWRLTQSAVEVQQMAINSYIKHDILGIEANESFIETLYYDPKMQFCIARFVNAVASLSLGRNYLIKNNGFLVTIIVELLRINLPKHTMQDSMFNDHLLATLQKLSLRNVVRQQLVDLRFVEYIIHYMEENYKFVSSYALEYTMAFFMNLCLNKNMIEKVAVSAANNIISLLINILNTRHEFCLPYVTGALYSLLSNKEINAVAKDLKLENVIERHISKTSGTICAQLEYILQLHKSDNVTSLSPAVPVGEKEEVDHIEAELDVSDDFRSPCGEEFLEAYKFKVDVGQQVVDTLKTPEEDEIEQILSVQPLQQVSADLEKAAKKSSDVVTMTDKVSTSDKKSGAKYHEAKRKTKCDPVKCQQSKRSSYDGVPFQNVFIDKTPPRENTNTTTTTCQRNRYCYIPCEKYYCYNRRTYCYR